MKSVVQAVQEFISGLELTAAEQTRAKEQKEVVRRYLRTGLSLTQDFLSGSYARSTAIRPLNDIDLFIVLDRDKHPDLTRSPAACLKAVRAVLDRAYPNKELPILQNRSVHIEFAGTGIGYDVVPAFFPPRSGLQALFSGLSSARDSDIYLIPDRETNDWIKTNPRRHQHLSTRANERAGKKLKPLVKALKHWNHLQGKPLRSFHLEVMAGSALTAPPASYLDGLSTLFHGLSSAVYRPCPEPAGLGPNLDADMTPGKRQHASEILRAAGNQVDRAISYAKNDSGNSLVHFLRTAFMPVDTAAARAKKNNATAHAHHLLQNLFGKAYPEKGTAP